MDRVRRAHEVEQDATFFAREEEPAAYGSDPGPLVLRYDAPSHFRERRIVERNDLVPRPKCVEPPDGALELGAPGSVLDRKVQVVTVGVDSHLRLMVQYYMQVRCGIVELHRGGVGVELRPRGPGPLKIQAPLSVAHEARRASHPLRVRHRVAD